MVMAVTWNGGMKLRVDGPQIQSPVLTKNMDMPMALMSTAKRDERRRGRYAKNSTVTPSAAAAIMAKSNASKNGSLATDTRSKPTNAPTTGITKNPGTASATPVHWVEAGMPASLSCRPGTAYLTTVPTTTTAGDMRIRLVSTRDLTFIEMVNILVQNVADPMLRASIITSFLGLFALPALLAGSVLIGFAFTAGYQRTNKRGATVLYGVVLGFVVYVVTELATRSGTAGVLDPAFAAMGPAFAAICIGLTVLLYKEDGRTR